jgi:hypothetical protein
MNTPSPLFKELHELAEKVKSKLPPKPSKEDVLNMTQQVFVLYPDFFVQDTAESIYKELEFEAKIDDLKLQVILELSSRPTIEGVLKETKKAFKDFPENIVQEIS